MKRLLIVMFFASCTWSAFAASPQEVRKQAQASLLVTGFVEIEPDGTVKDYVIDQPDKLPPVVTDVISKNVPTWKFEPVIVNGTAREAKSKMSLRIVAKQVDDKHDSVSIAAADFGANDSSAGETVTYKTRQIPKYPRMSIDARVSGAVYLLVLIDRQGLVGNAIAEQVNLFVYASDRDMDRYRKDLANAALSAVKHWTFNIPSTGKHVNDEHWVARVPINFNLTTDGSTRPQERYGMWQVYIPGPRQIAPWAEKSKLLSDSPDAQPMGTLSQVGEGPRLMTPLGGA